MIYRDRRVNELVELRKLVDVFPYLTVSGMENMRAVNVHVNAGDLLRIAIAGDMLPLIYHETAFSSRYRFVCKHSAKQPRANYQVIVLHYLRALPAAARASVP